MFPIVSLDEFRARLERFEAWLWGPGAEALGLGDPARQVSALARDVEALSDLYTLERESIAEEARGEAALAAKVFYFLCSDAPRTYFVLRELAERYGGHGASAQNPSLRPDQLRPGVEGADDAGLRLLDVGAGVGAASVGLLLALDATRTQRVFITALDVDSAALRPWRLIVTGAARVAGVQVETRSITTDLATGVASLDEVAGERWDLAIAQSVLNEMFVPSATDAASAWVASLARRSMTIIIEPALHVTTRALQRVRDRLAADPTMAVLAPCPHARPCPMLAAGERDWCHEVRWLKPTPRVAQVQAITRRRDERCKYSFLVAALEPSPFGRGQGEGSSVGEISLNRQTQGQRALTPTLSQGERGPEQSISGRLVSDPLGSKGKTERFICTSTGELITLRVLDRERSESNELALTAPQGAIVRIENAPRWPRIGPEARVTIETHSMA